MKIIVQMVISFCICTLFSCTSYHSNQTKDQVASCLASCAQKGNQCNKVCDLNCQNCRIKSNCTTAKGYNVYRREQSIQGFGVARELNSYRDPLQCRKVTCNCQADYQICMQSCGGVIHKQLRVASAC